MTKSNKNPSENPINGCGCISCILILSAVLLRIGYGLEGLGVSRGVVAGIFIVILIAYVIGIPIVVITFVVKAFKNNTISEEEESLVEESRKGDVEKFKKVIDCPYRYYDTVSSDKLLKDYNESLERGKIEGFIPIIIDVNDALLMDIEFNHKYIEKIRTMRKELIDNASSYEGKRWLDETLKEYQEDSEHYQKILGIPSDKGYEIQKLALEEKYVLLAEVPVSEPWQLLAWFPFSYYNDCPDNKALANVGKYWFEQYGAVPAFIGHNMLWMTVPRPVNDAQSLNLAKEQYAFCPNRFEVSYIQTILQTIHALADSLRKSTVWKFRWEY
ncbi:protein of unknown function [Bacteroidales bacterium KHT7]|nr:protein of unknown function [Bacteroidales bacterium KHT7]